MLYFNYCCRSFNFFFVIDVIIILVFEKTTSLRTVGFKVLLVKVAETDVAILTTSDKACTVRGEGKAIDRTEVSLNLADLCLQDEVVEYCLELRLVHRRCCNLTGLLTATKDNLVLQRRNLQPNNNNKVYVRH